MEVTLKVRGNMLGVFPTNKYIEQVLKPVATAKVRAQVRQLTKQGMQTKSEFENVELFYTDKGILHIFSGLEDDVKKALKAVGMKVKVKRLGVTKLVSNVERLDDEDLENLQARNDQVEVIGLVCDHPRNFIVEAPTGWGKSFAIVQIAKILPDTSIAIIAPGIEIMQTLYKRLKKHIKAKDLGMVGGGSSSIRRITLCTMQSMQKLRHEKWDLMLFDEVHRAGGRKTANDVAEVFARTKCVGFSASPKGRSDNADKVVRALFGPVIYKVDYSEAEGRGSVVPIKVDMYRITRGREHEQKYKNRYGLWRNDIRNEFIAKLAKENIDNGQVLITVATAEHALELKMLLPEFAVVFKSATSRRAKEMIEYFQDVKSYCRRSALSKDRVNYLRREFENNNIQGAIATQVWSTGVDFIHLRTLIRAEGTASSIQSTQVPGRLSRNADGKTHGLLIDFIDEFDSTLGGRSQSRRISYVKKGWDVNVLEHPDVTTDRWA